MKTLIAAIVFAGVFCSVEMYADTTSPFSGDNFSVEYSLLDGKPTVHLYGGIGQLFHEDIVTRDVELSGMIHLGTERKWVDELSGRMAVKSTTFFVGVSNTKTVLGQTVAGIPLTSDSDVRWWHVGSMDITEFGYTLDAENKSAILLGTSQSNLTLSVLDVSNLPPSDAATLNNFAQGLRISSVLQPSIGIRVNDAISVKARASWHQMYQTIVFWPYVGASITEGLASAIVGQFCKRIGRSSPSIQPIMSFLLTNAVHAGFAFLRQKNGHFPFSSEPTLNVINYEVGIALHL
jgi:hypothetical protein